LIVTHQQLPDMLMKAVQLSSIRTFDFGVVPDPRIVNDTDVLVRIATVGVCGSDMHYYTTGRIGTQVVQFPFIIGHEAAGVVEKTGKKVSRVHAGQRIALDPAVSCGECDQCRAGREHTCRKLRFMGCPQQLEGCMCEFVVLPENNCFPIPDGMSFEQATLAEPLAIGVYAVERTPLTPASDVAILGTGPIGMSVFHTIRTRQIANVFVTDRIAERLSFAQALHPRWAGNPNEADVVDAILAIAPSQMDAVFECSGDAEALTQAVQLLKPGGTLALVGIPETDDITFPIHELRRKEISIINIRRQLHCTQKAIDLLASKTIQMDSMVTHRFSLEQSPQAFDLVANYRDGVMKAMISIE
jgi:L-iditol 2-dehydrogenase